MNSIIEQPRFSCALAAQTSVLAIPRAVPVIHAGPGCASKTFAFAAEGCGNQGEGFGGGDQIASTNTGEKEVVFGGEEKLRTLIANALKVLNADLFVVLAGCTSGIVGDDVVSVAREFREQGFSVVGAETSGFKGNNYYGHELILESVIDQFVGDVKPVVQKGLVNVFAVVPNQNPFWRGDLEELKRILSLAGLTVNILFGSGSAGISEWKNIPNAQYNILLSPYLCKNLMESLKEKYGTPYFHYPLLPMGAKASSLFLRTLAKELSLDEAKIEGLIKTEEDRFYDYFISITDWIVGSKSNIPNELYTIADASYALGVADFLVNELGFTPKGVYAVDEPASEKGKEALLKSAGLVLHDNADLFHIESDGGKIQEDIRKQLEDSNRAVIFGSTWDGNLAKETGNLYLPLSLPLVDDFIVTRSYTGYTGGLRLLEDVFATAFRRGKITRSTQTL